MDTVTLFGVPVRNITLDDAISLIQECVEEGGSHSILLYNAHTVNLVHGDPELRGILGNATHVFPDGIGVRIAGILCGRRLKPDLNPTDLYPRLCEALQGTGVRLFFLGGEPGIAEKARAQALSEFPRLLISGVHHGYFSAEDEAEVITAIRQAGTDILLVGLGQPKQEKWIARNLAATRAKVGMGIGALFDYHAGKTKRAPLWMRRLGLEWLGRLLPGRGEPRRLWRRYLLGNLQFLWRSLVCGVQERRRLHSSLGRGEV